MSNPADDITALYAKAFRDFGTLALWNLRPAANPTPDDALAITQPLRTHGRMEGRRLAEQIEAACHTAHHAGRASAAGATLACCDFTQSTIQF